MAILSHDANTQCVEGADHDLLCALANEFSSALAHFSGRFVGKGDGGNAFGFKAYFNESSNFLRDHARFARASAGQDQTGAFDVIDGFELGRI